MTTESVSISNQSECKSDVIMTTDNIIPSNPEKSTEILSFFSGDTDFTSTDVDIEVEDVVPAKKTPEPEIIVIDDVEFVQDPDPEDLKDHILAQASYLLNKCEVAIVPSKNGVPQMAVGEGKAYEDPTYGLSQIDRWKSDRRMEYSIICGEPSQIVVIDVDDRAYLESMILPAITAHRLPMPYTIVRGSAPGRCHMYYRLPVGQTIKSGPVPGSNGKVEIKSTGTYIRGPWTVLKDHKIRARAEHVDGKTLTVVRHYEPFIAVKGNMKPYSFLPYDKEVGDIDWKKIKKVIPPYAGMSLGNSDSHLQVCHDMYTDSLTEYVDEWWVLSKPGRKSQIKVAPGSTYLSWSANGNEILSKMLATINSIDASEGNKNLPTYRVACTILIDYRTEETQALSILTEWATRKGCEKHIRSCFSSAQKQLASRLDRGLPVGRLLVGQKKLDDVTQTVKSSMKDYKLTNKGEAIYNPSIANLAKIFRQDPRIILIQDPFTGMNKILIDGVTHGAVLIQNSHKQTVVEWLSDTYGMSFSDRHVGDFLNNVSDLHESQDSLLDHVKSLPSHENESLLDTWLIKATGCEDTKLNRAYSRKYVISMMARAYATAEKPAEVHTVLLLKGNQGAGKSTLFKVLAGRADHRDLHSDAKIDFASSEAIYKIRGVWLYELAELSSLKKSEIEEVKAYLSQKQDNERLKYDRQASTPVRRVVFGGSTNSDTPLKDETGNRRWWVVQVGTMDILWLSQYRDAILGAARHAYLTGMADHTPHLWWLSPEEESLQRSSVSIEVEREEVLVESISNWLDISQLTTGQTFSLKEVADGVNLQVRSRSDELRLSKALKYLGYSIKKIWKGGKTVSVWMKDGHQVTSRVLSDSDALLISFDEIN